MTPTNDWFIRAILSLRQCRVHLRLAHFALTLPPSE